MYDRDNSCVIDRDTLDDEHTAKFEKPWIFDADDEQRQFDTEDEACAYQRSYRAARGFNPMTGDPYAPITQDAFDQATDDATHDVITA